MKRSYKIFISICIIILFTIFLRLYIQIDLIDLIEPFISVRKNKILYPWKDIEITKEEEKKYFPDKYHKNYQNVPQKNGKIFVSIASYRDPECMTTVKQLFEKAYNWKKINIGICTQNKEDDKVCIDDSFNLYKSNIKQIKMSHMEARGPQFARYLCSHLWDGEQYFLMIDSHLLFRQNWDKILIDMYNSCPSKKSILTGYPPDHDSKNPYADNTFTYTCKSHFKDDFHIISSAQYVNTDKPELPWATPYVSAGFFFTRSEWLIEVPFDPYTPHLFQGEEILLAIRSYTHGWDIFNLNTHVCTHHYDRRKDKLPHFWEDHNDYYKIQKLSNMRYYYIINQCKLTDVHPIFRKEIEYYGVGKERSIAEFFNFSKMDLQKGVIDSRCDQKYNFSNKNWIKR